MTNNTPNGTKKHRDSTEQKVTRLLKFFLSSDGLVQIRVTLSQRFSHKTAALSTEQCTFFPGLKSHEALWTAHWRTMASLAMPFFFTCTHTLSGLCSDLSQSEGSISLVIILSVWTRNWFSCWYVLCLRWRPVHSSLCICDVQSWRGQLWTLNFWTWQQN